MTIRNFMHNLLMIAATLLPMTAYADLLGKHPFSDGNGSLLPVGYLSTSGNQIVSSNGVPVRLACAGYFHPGGLNHASVQSDVAGMVAAGFNCLRFPWYNSTMSADLAEADKIVAAAKSVGLAVILDHHGDEGNHHPPYPCNGLPFDLGPGSDGTNGCGVAGTVTEAKFVSDWVTIAQHCAGNSTVIGFDLTNEPHLAPLNWSRGGGSTWGNGGATDLLAIYQQAGNAIHAVNPGVLIIAEAVINETGTFFNGQASSIKCAPDLTTAGSLPVVLNVPHKLVYSIHTYPVTIGCGHPDSGPTKIAGMNQTWGYLVTQNIAPMFIGEMGASLDGVGSDSVGTLPDGVARLADEQAWAATLLAYVNGEYGAQGGPTFTGTQQGISTDWWAWGDLSGQRPNGTLESNGQVNPSQQAVYKELRYIPK